MNMDNIKTNNVSLFIVHLLSFHSLVHRFSWAKELNLQVFNNVELFSKLCQCFPKDRESCLPIFVRNLQVLKTRNSFLHMLFMKRAKVSKSHIETDACRQLSNLARGRYSGLMARVQPVFNSKRITIKLLKAVPLKAAKHSHRRAHGLESRSLNGLGFSAELWSTA